MTVILSDILEGDYLANQDQINLARVLANRVLNSPAMGTVDATGDQDVKTTVAMEYAINGKINTKAITATIDLSAATMYDSAGNQLAAIDAQTAAYDCAYGLIINAAGTVSVVKGEEVATGGSVVLPDVPDSLKDTHVMFAALKVVNTTNAFTLGTTKASATGVTFTHYNLSGAVPGITL